jgi:hypothetical protein
MQFFNEGVYALRFFACFRFLQVQGVRKLNKCLKRHMVRSFIGAKSSLLFPKGWEGEVGCLYSLFTMLLVLCLLKLYSVK